MKEILRVLRENARLSEAEIGRRVGKSEEEVRTVISQLESDKVVLGYQAVVNPEKSGDGALVGIIEVKVTPQRETGFDAIAQRIYQFPEVKLCYLLSGAYDLLLIVEGDTLQDVAKFVSEKLAPLEPVASTTTHFILKKYKEFGISLTDVATSERLPVSP